MHQCVCDSQLKSIHHFLSEVSDIQTTHVYMRVPGAGKILFIKDSASITEIVNKPDLFFRCNPLDSQFKGWRSTRKSDWRYLESLFAV